MKSTVVTAPSEIALDLQRLPATVYLFRVEADGTAWFPYVSRACSDLYGFSPEDAMADVDLMHRAIHPEDRKAFDEAGQQSLRTLEALRWTGRIVSAGGVDRHVLIASRPRRGRDSSTEWLGVVTDLHESLTIGSVGGEGISDVQADARAIVGHDIAGPLTTIIASAEWGLEDLDRAGALGMDASVHASLQRRLHVIMRQAGRIRDLRDDLLAVAAADADADSLRAEPQVVDVLPYLRAAADLEGTGLRLRVACPPDLFALVQPSHLSQILANLVSNAVRYAKSEVALTGWRAGDRVLVAVRDDGPGVSPDASSALFQRFSHAGMRTRPPGAGAGLGLYIVRTLTAANHGTVLFTPSEDAGAGFTVALLAAARQGPQPRPGPRAGS